MERQSSLVTSPRGWSRGGRPWPLPSPRAAPSPGFCPPAVMNDTRCPAPADKPLPETHSTGDIHSDRFCRKILQWSLRLYLALSPLSTEKKKANRSAGGDLQ
jgi:hypothetical protein